MKRFSPNRKKVKRPSANEPIHCPKCGENTKSKIVKLENPLKGAKSVSRYEYYCVNCNSKKIVV